MQSQTVSNPVPTLTLEEQLSTAVQPQQSESDAQNQENKSPAPTEEQTAMTSEKCQTGEQNAEMPTSMDVTEPLESHPGVQPQMESCGNTGKMDGEFTAIPSVSAILAPDTTNPVCDAQNEKKQSKGVNDGRKYVPSKKAMIDPLKMDMSKPVVIPLTSSQLSLQCIECHIIFSDHKSKERHLKLSHPAEYEQCILRNALFACYVCDRHFTNSTDLMAHQKTHTEKKPFKCPICGLAYKKSSELTVHKKVHFGQDGYACTDCGKTCKTLTLLRYHQRTHTGERPYVCKECGKRFTMPKALQKHTAAHLREGEAKGDSAKKELKKNDGTTRYPCSLCKATFKSLKTRLHHMKTKHNNAASNARPAGHQLKQNTPIITPISISQSTLLQVAPNGPLQKVDANIDTEQIRKLIESLGNVQKVNQVVILGQVPPHAPPLQVQQFSQPLEPMTLNLTPPQIDFTGLKQTGSKDVEPDPLNNPCDSMEIILEPITPDGQLENPPFSALGPHIAACENIELTLVEAEQTARPEGEMMPLILQQPDISVVHSDLIVCENEVENLKENLEQTVILELTPALIETLELEQPQTEPQNEITSSPPVLNSDQETPAQTADQAVIEEQETGLSVPPLMPTVELELTPLNPEQQDLSTCPFVPPDVLRHASSESEMNSNQDIDSHVTTNSEDQIPEMDEKTPGQGEQNVSEKSPIEGKTDPSEVEKPSAKEEAPSLLQTKPVSQNSELPVNVMSAQELVKVRKRKPARTFIFQGYMQDWVGSIYQDDFLINTTPSKRQRAKKSHLVVKFGPQSKDKKSKKQKKPTQKGQPIQGKTSTKTLSEKKVPSPNKRGKGKKNKTKGNVSGDADNKSPSNQAPQVPQITEDKGKSKMNKQKVAKEGGVHTSEHKSFASPMFKKKKQAKIIQKDQPKSVKSGKAKKSLARDKKVKSANAPEPHIMQDSLLLLKGHKQPQLKVYKLDPSKASGQTPEASSSESQTSPHSTTGSPNNPSLEGKKKGGKAKKNQKALSLLSSLKVSNQPSDTLPTKPKTTRKRKSSSKVETEGVITSKRALECKDCGERFSEVSSLQKHKTSAHIVESPSLTYTNGNIFEGVSRLDLYQLPKAHEKVVHAMNAATDWDIEPEAGDMALEDRERSVSFPALIPSPSLQIPPQDVELSSHEDRAGSKTGADTQSDSSTNIPFPSDEVKNTEVQQNVTSEAPSLTSTQTKSSETEEPSTSDEGKQEEDVTNTPGSEVQGTNDEDVKEDLLLEVDLVTVGEQNEREDPVSVADTVPENEPDRSCGFESGSIDKHSEQVSDGTTERSLTSQTVSCSTHQVEVKEEEEETAVQKRKAGGKGGVRNAPRGRKRGSVHLKRDATPKKSSVSGAVRGTESENDQDCQVVYEKCPRSSEVMDSEVSTKSLTRPEFGAIKAPGTSLPSVPPALEESNEEPVVFELESLTTSVEEVMNERAQEQGEENDRETDQSPGIILERFLTARQSPAADEEMGPMSARSNQKQGLDRVSENGVEVFGRQEIKVEENSSDFQLVAPTCPNRQRASVQPQHHRDIRTVLVKEEGGSMVNDAQLVQQSSKRVQWNAEPVGNENTDIPFMECEETTRDCRVSPEFNTNQCIFYPVKEEEREVLLGAAQSNRGSSTPEEPSDANPSEHQTADCDACEGRSSAPDYQDTLVGGLPSEPGVGDFAEGQAAASDSEGQNPSDFRDFLLWSCDENDTSGFELSDPHRDTEAEVMAYFNKNKQRADQTAPRYSVSTSASCLQEPQQENQIRKPVDYFSKYFGWDTWVEIATCTNKLSKMPTPVTCREVARFVGTHIAMGTLKFPSPRLYWEDFTKVPLIAEAIPLTRFLELSRTLKLTSSSDDPSSGSALSQKEAKACLSDQGVISHNDDSQCQGHKENTSAQNDPLWKIQPLLSHFNTGCQPLRQHGDYAIDQYSLPLTGKVADNRPALLCTTLIGFGGLLSRVDFKLDLSDKEDAAEQVSPRGSTVFLCKQELSTPAMLERLLGAGVHGAGRVGGARGQMGDEFVSSDGKLMLRRSRCGFILSTAGNNQRNVASLMESFETAQMSARLNRDLLNLYSIPLVASAPTCWPQAVLWYLIDAALVNSWLLYRQENGAVSAPLTFMAFRLEVSKALILSSSSDTQDSVPPQPPSENAHATSETPNPIRLEDSPLPDAATRYDGSGHWPEQLTEGEGGRCRFGDCQRTSRVLCLKCCVFLCISRNHNCFLNFHNQGSLEKE